MAGHKRRDQLPALIQVPGGTITTVPSAHARLGYLVNCLALGPMAGMATMKRDIVVWDKSGQAVYREGPYDDKMGSLGRRAKQITSEISKMGLESWLRSKPLENGQLGPVRTSSPRLTRLELAEAEGNYLKYSLSHLLRRPGRKPADSD